MADYNGTDEDDIIDVSELDSDIGNIYPGKGNDTVTNATSKHTIISGPGEDNISGINFKYAVWNAEQKVKDLFQNKQGAVLLYQIPEILNP